ncbi:unnamed protein product [Laminaria digitata]
MQEALGFATERELRRLFTTLILHGAPAPPLWEEVQVHLSLDFAVTMCDAASSEVALKHVDHMLNKHGRSTNQFVLPNVHHDNTKFDRLLNAFNRTEQAELAQSLTPQLTAEQRHVFDAVNTNALQDTGGLYMIDAPAGTGKTFTECTMAAHLRSQGKLVLCAASTGIAALILPGGLAAHSTFKLPFGDDAVDGSVSNVKAESDRADVLRRASLIIWDGVVMSSKFAPEALNLTLPRPLQERTAFRR